MAGQTPLRFPRQAQIFPRRAKPGQIRAKEIKGKGLDFGDILVDKPRPIGSV
jgi:hypothetical protein